MPDRLVRAPRALLAAAALTAAALAGPLFGVPSTAGAQRPAGAPDRAAYRDPGAPIETRVRDLLGRMTLEEKAAQLRAMWFGKSAILDTAGAFSPSKAATALADGIGQIARPGDGAGTRRGTNAFRGIEETVTLVNAIQRHLVERTRLGIPALFHEETAHGYAQRDATIFQVPPGLASTWDPPLVEQAFAVAAREARLRGATVALSPVLDLARDPRYGRVEEFFGEDPFLVAQMGIAAVRGQQGRARPLAADKVFVTLKHFVHATPQGGINLAPADIGERALREAYLVPFEAVVRAADPAIIMPSYNEVGGVPAHANRALLLETGRTLLGFRGAYFSDYGGVTNLVTHHRMAADHDEAAVLALNAGVDAELPDGQAYAKLPALVRAGRVAEPVVDSAVARVLRLKFEAGLFERPYVDATRAVRETNTPADVRLARTVAQRSIVLLKNDGVLPLDPRAALKLAVIGPNAEAPVLGGYSGVNAKAVGVLAGVRAAAGRGMSIEYAEGVRITAARGGNSVGTPIVRADSAENAARIAEAVRVARQADVVLLVVGDTPEVTREAVHPGAPGDRSTLGLFGDQDALVDAVLATGKPVVALLLNGRPLAVTRLAERANALLEGWYLGQEGGNAVADVLFGAVNPGGKLPVSFPRSAGELPVYYNRHPSADVNRYIEGKRAPLFPFGFGLSYTTFELSQPRLTSARIAAADTAVVEVDVSNTGKRAGDEVVQLYVRDDVSSVPRPVLELKGFQRVTLAPGERRTVRFALPPDALAFWNVDMRRVVEPGTFTISTGPSSTSLKSTTLTVY